MKKQKLAGEKINMDTLQNDFFHGVDVPLVLKAIKTTGLKVTPNVLEVAQDVVADAIVSHDKERDTKLNSWVFSYIRYQLRNYITLQLGKSARNKKYAPKAVYSLDANINDSEGFVLHEIIPSEFDIENLMLRNSLKEKLSAAISKLDERGQFAMRFYLNSDNPPRCGRALGEALAENGLVSYRGKDGKDGNKRSRAQQILQECFKNLKIFLGAMGVDEETIQDD